MHATARPGASNLISIVLLIAIVLLASAALWFWAIPMLGKSTTQQSFVIRVSDCNSSHAYVTNLGGADIPLSKLTAVPVYSEDTHAQVASLNVSNMPAGYTEWRSFNVPLSEGDYYAVHTNLPFTPFTC